MNYQEQLFTIVSEECNEVAQMCSKCLRFGPNEIKEGRVLSNKELLRSEFNDLVGAMELLFGSSINDVIDHEAVEMKKIKIRKYQEYSKQIGTLHD